MKKLSVACCTALLAISSSLASAHPHQVPQPPAPPAPPALPSMPPVPPVPPLPPLPVIDIPDEALAACESKADRTRVEVTTADGARVSGTCRKRGNVIAFVLEKYELNNFTFTQRKQR